MMIWIKKMIPHMSLFLQQMFLTFGIELAFLFLFLLFGVVRYGALDDYFMSVVLTGGGNSLYDPHLVFINAAYGYFLKPFYYLFPFVGWFYIFEVLSVFVSFWVISFFVIRQLGLKLGVPLSVLLSAQSLSLYSDISFTVCAAVLVSAGALLFNEGCSRNDKKIFVLAGFLLIAGAIMRWQMFLLGLPFLFITLALKLQLRDVLKVRNLIALALCGIAVFCLQKFDQQLYLDQEYQYYKSYQGARSLFGDGGHYDKDAVYDELENRGLSGQDFQLLTSWNFYDTEVFSADSLKLFIDAVNRNAYTINWKRVPAAIALALSNAFTRNEAWFWCLLCISVLLTRNRKSRLYPWCSLGAIVLCYSYLFLQNRLVTYVEMGIWTYAMMMTIPLIPNLQELKETIPQRYSSKISIALSLVTLCFVVSGIYMFPRIEKDGLFAAIPLKSEGWKLFTEYAENHPKDVFLLDFIQYKELGMVKDPAYKAAAPGSWKNIIPIGYWNIHLPSMKRELERRGVENPLRDMIHENVYLLESGNTPKYLSFYARHYHKNLVVDTIETLGDLKLLKYREKRLP